MNYTREILKNGIRIVTITGIPSKAITMTAYLKAGFRCDPPAKPGLSHFTEHMVFNGTKSYSSTREEAEAVEKHGGWHMAYTWIEEQKHIVHLPKNNFEEGCSVLLESIFAPIVSKEEIEREKGVIKEEVLKNKSDPAKAIWNYVWFPLFFQSTPLARPYYGSLESISNISKADVDGFIESRFSPNNVVLLVAGDIDRKYIKEKMEEKVDKLLKNKLFKIDHSLKSIKPSRKKKFFVHNDPAYYTTSIIIGVETVPFTYQEKHILNILMDMVGGYFGANLIQKLRDEGGLIYTWGAYQDNISDTGYFAFNASTAHNNVLKVLKIILSEFKRLASGEFTQEEVEVARGHLIGSLLSNVEKGQDYIEWYGLQELLNPKRVLSIEEQIKIYKTVDFDMIKSIAARYLTKKNILIGVLGRVNQSEVEILLKV